MLETLKQSLEEIRGKRVKYYTLLEYKLDSPRLEEVINIAGAYFYVLNLDGTAKIRLNELAHDSIDLFKYRQIASPFYRFFLSHAAQAGKTLLLAIGIGSEVFSIQDFQSPDLTSVAADMSDLKKSFVHNFGTQISKSNSVTGISAVIMHTVSTGKSLLLEFFTFQGATASGVNTKLFVRDAGDAEQFAIVHNLANNAPYVGSLIILIPESYDVCLGCDAAGSTARAFIKGREI